MPEPDLLATTGADGRDLLAAAETDWSRPIPHCPDWDAAQLVAHMGAILAWIATIVTTGQRVARRDREVPPTNRDEMAGWYSNHLDRTLHILGTTDSKAPTWTFSSRGERWVSWWRRRLAVELAIHRWDAQHAASLDGGPPPRQRDGDVAAAIAGHIKADTAIRGTRSDLLLWVTNRAPSHHLEILGRTDLAVAWARLRR